MTLHTQAALSEFGRQHIDILVSNAAVNPAGGPILQMDDRVIDKILEVRMSAIRKEAAIAHWEMQLLLHSVKRHMPKLALLLCRSTCEAGSGSRGKQPST